MTEDKFYDEDYSKDNSDVIAMYDAVKAGTKTQDDWKVFMIEYLENYVKSLIRQMHMTANADYEDLMSAAFEKILINIPKYDPRKSRPATFFKGYIMEALGNEQKTGNKHYEKQKRILNKAAQAHGYADCMDPFLIQHPHLLTKFTDGKVALKTVTETQKYLTAGACESFEALTENHEFESPFKDPATIMIHDERKKDIAQVVNSRTSFEQFVIANCWLNEDSTMTNRGIMKYLSQIDMAEVFADDEISKRKKINSSYLDKRILLLRRSLAVDPKIKRHVTIRETLLSTVDSTEQASMDDLNRAFDIGDILDDEEN